MERRHHHGHRNDHHSHHSHHSHHATLPPIPSGQPGTSTGRHRQSSSDRVLPRFLEGLRTFQHARESKQLDQLAEICEALHLPFERQDYVNELPWIIKRVQLFKSLPTTDQEKYLEELISWRRSVCGSRGPTDFEYVVYLLPGLAHYVKSIRTDTYRASRDGGWFAWLNTNGLRRDRDGGVRFEGDLKADWKLLEHVMQYEAIRGRPPVIRRSPDDPLALPPISEILRQNHYY